MDWKIPNLQTLGLKPALSLSLLESVGIIYRIRREGVTTSLQVTSEIEVALETGNASGKPYTFNRCRKSCPVINLVRKPFIMKAIMHSMKQQISVGTVQAIPSFGSVNCI